MSRDTLHTAAFDALRIRLASPEKIREWSSGEVKKPETINYRTQKPEKTGLFAQEIFGPVKDWECACGKYKKIRYKGIVCDKCGVEVTHSLVRRERMGHINLAAPVTHIWFLRSIPSKIGLVLNMSIKNLEKVVYFASFVITHVNQAELDNTKELLQSEAKSKKKQIVKAHEKAKAEAKEQGLAGADLEAIDADYEAQLESLDEELSAAEADLKRIKMLEIISENEYQMMSMRFGHLFEAEIGAGAIYTLLRRLDIEKTVEKLTADLEKTRGAKYDKIVNRIKVLKNFSRNEIKPEWMVLTAIPVIPPDLRPMVALDGGRFATSDLNDLYRRVINRNNRLKRLIDLNAPEVICRNEKRMLQEAVDALIDNNARASKTVTASTGQKRQLRSLADILKGKQGRFRQNLLGKRVDYSGRSVIVVGPNLSIDECGIPKRMALEMFKPFVMAGIIKRELAHNVRSASRFIESNAPEVWDILEEVIKDRRVLLNRAPTLHRLGIQAYRPVLIEGKAIQLHPLSCSGFNADFDGDQMAVHVPLSEQAKNEAENLIAAEKNLLKPATGSPIKTPQQDIALGVYYITRYADDAAEATMTFSNITEAKFAYKSRKIGLKDKINVRFDDLSKFEEGIGPIVETSVGRILFNEIFPAEIGYLNKTITKKELGKIIQLLLEFCGQERTAFILDAMKRLGYKYATKSGYSLGVFDYGAIEGKQELLEEGDERINLIEEQYQEGLLTKSERHTKIIETWTEIKDRIMTKMKGVLDQEGPVFAMIDSGARGNWSQVGQAVAMKGLVTSPSGDIIELPVKGNFKEGFDVLEFFISSHGTRKGLSDTALRTANAGYLTRRLVDVAQDVVTVADDCGNKEGILITREDSERMGQTVAERVMGRFVCETVKDADGKTVVKKGEVITEEIGRKIAELDLDQLQIRSVLTCEMPKGVCVKCYGFDLSNNKVAKLGAAVGIIAAQSIGEPGTQLTMRTFHTGGVASDSDITQGLPRVDELLERRNPKRKAILSEVNGSVEIEDADGKVITSSTGRKIFEGRRGQKIVKVHFDGMDETEFKMLKRDEVKVEDGDKVKKGQLLMILGATGEEIKSPYEGLVKFGRRKLILSYEGRHTKEYIVPIGYKVLVKDGEEVEKGQQLTEGSINLQELHELRGSEAVQKYILKEIQGIYAAQGQRLNDKHVEIIIKQMLSRMYIEDAGETDLLPGETVEKTQFILENRRAKAAGLKQAQGRELLLGISRVSLSTQSLLSAASFQETSKVLINAAVSGKIDYLEGLKENVIIGRLIPVGTGFGAKQGSAATDDQANDSTEEETSSEEE